MQRHSPAPDPFRYSVIIPAHDEERTIARALTAIGAHDGCRVIVVCNGCRDRTAEAARRSAPHAAVIELAEGGKSRALNAALELVGQEPAIVVDADVEITPAALDALAEALSEEGVWAASPGAEFELSGASPWVRSYYRVFARHPYLRAGVGGSGVYGLSAAGRAALGPLPRIISDDGFVRTKLPEANQRRVWRSRDGTPVLARVRPPRGLGELLKSEARWRRGDRELAANGGKPAVGRSVLLRLVRTREIAAIDALCYAAIKLIGRLTMLREKVGTDGVWHKDASSRG